MAVAEGDALDVGGVGAPGELVDRDRVADVAREGVDARRRHVAGALDLAAAEKDVRDAALAATQVDHGAVHALRGAAAVEAAGAEGRAGGAGRVSDCAAPGVADLERLDHIARGEHELTLEPGAVALTAKLRPATESDRRGAEVGPGGEEDGAAVRRLVYRALYRRRIVRGAVAGGSEAAHVESRAGARGGGGRRRRGRG